MKCEGCEGRWVARTVGGSIRGERVSYHFAAEALECPRCGEQGVADEAVFEAHQRHPDVVASRIDSVRPAL